MKFPEGHDWRSLLPAAFAVAALLAVFLSLPPADSLAAQLPSSGDALYDRLAGLVSADLQQSSYNLIVPDDYILGSELAFRDEPGRINSASVLEWISEFSDDPAYWQLCWLLRSKGSVEDYVRPERYCCPVFQEVWRSGVRDEASCYLMLLQATPAEKPGLIASGRAQWPDNSYWHYEEAGRSLEARDWAGFVTAMQIGNAAVRNELPRPWPLSLLGENGGLPADADSQAVQGVLVQLARSQRLGALRSPPDPVELRGVQDLDQLVVEDYVTMQVRLATMDGNGLEQLWRPAVSLSRLLNSPGLGDNWAAGHRQVLERQRIHAIELADAELPKYFGTRIAGQQSQAAATPSGGDGQQYYERDQASWINTLQSYRQDLQRARERGSQFTALLISP